MAAALLVELLAEELPPKALRRLGEAFAAGLVQQLVEQAFVAADSRYRSFVTPRRLAVLVPDVKGKQPDRELERRGPAVKSALDAAGKPTSALLGFAKSCGVELSALERRSGEKGEYFIYRAKQKGEALKSRLADMVTKSLKQLPIPKLMRWGAGEAQFVRPVHAVVMLHGKTVVPGGILGRKSGRKTRGHRFLSKGWVSIDRAENYEKLLKRHGVVASLEERIAQITAALDEQVKAIQGAASWRLGASDELVSEVASLVEYPAVYVGAFDEAFLAVPRECLIVSMQHHQRYFPLADQQGRLLPRFVFVSNMKTARPQQIIHGNERVLRARLSDAKFFYEQDRKTSLAARVPRLAEVVYLQKLGTQLDRVERITRLARAIGQRLIDLGLAPAGALADIARAAYLSKADLLTDMVGEFPELQGTMGRYYALHDGEAREVAEAIEQHYFPKTAAGPLPDKLPAVCVALADKLDALVGIWGVGLVPTGDKDPYALRRQALGVLRILGEKALALDLLELLEAARAGFAAEALAQQVVAEVHAFILERLKPFLREKGIRPDEIEAVVDRETRRVDQILPRVQALQAFRRLPQAEALAAANKRIHNILRRAGALTNAADVDDARLTERSERELLRRVSDMAVRVRPLREAGDYTAVLTQLAALREPVDAFFDEVLVMAEDEAVRRSRLSLLANVRALFLQVADLSRLQS